MGDIEVEGFNERKNMKCALCNEDKKLSNSHIIPEFIYAHSGIYDDKHRYNVLSSDAEQSNKFEQKGVREKLLCKDCEAKLSDYETYAKTILYDETQIDEIRSSQNVTVFTNIDYLN